MNDPIERAKAMAAARASQMSDTGIGGGHSSHDHNHNQGRLPSSGTFAADVMEDTGLDVIGLPSGDSLHARLSPERQAQLADEILTNQLQAQRDKNTLELEDQRFRLSRNKELFVILKRFAGGFGVISGLSFLAVMTVLVYTGWTGGALSDTSVLGSILNVFGEIFKAIAGSN